MREAGPAKLVLGSVQLGLPYGVANRTGMPSGSAALRLVCNAIHRGITEIDTARAYGESESRLGAALKNCNPVRTITKLSPLSELQCDAPRDVVRAAVDRSVSESLAALGRSHLDCLLLHRAAHLTAFDGAVWQRILELVQDGTAVSVGVSAQTPDEALLALERAEIRHLQLPFNLLDWRWRKAGVIDRIRARPDVTVHARSAFLQGLLASADPSIWPEIGGVVPNAVIGFVQWLANEYGRTSAADLCLAYVRGQDWIDGVVVGMETEDQLDANLEFFARPALDAAECQEIARRVPRVPEQLLNPALWPKAA